MNEFNQNYRSALEDFFDARRRANLRSFFAKNGDFFFELGRFKGGIA